MVAQEHGVCLVGEWGLDMVYPGWDDAPHSELKSLVRLHEQMKKKTEMFFDCLYERMQLVEPVRLTHGPVTLIPYGRIHLARSDSEARFGRILPASIHSCRHAANQTDFSLNFIRLRSCKMSGTYQPNTPTMFCTYMIKWHENARVILMIVLNSMKYGVVT